MFIDFSGLICFDIETAPSHFSLDELGNENPRLRELWIDLHNKSVAKEEERFINSDPDESYILNAGLYAEFARIVCASFSNYSQDEDGYGKIGTVSVCGDDEPGIINMTNRIFSKSTWISGHNVKGFDIPFFSRRAYINGIMPDSSIDMVTKKPWDVRVLDTKDIWNFGAYGKGGTSLDLITTVLGMESPKIEHFGAHVASMYWNDKDHDGIAKYCEGDVISTLKVLIRFAKPAEDLASISVVRKQPMMLMCSEAP
jgi:hypothetical protein